MAKQNPPNPHANAPINAPTPITKISSSHPKSVNQPAYVDGGEKLNVLSLRKSSNLSQENALVIANILFQQH